VNGASGERWHWEEKARCSDAPVLMPDINLENRETSHSELFLVPIHAFYPAAANSCDWPKSLSLNWAGPSLVAANAGFARDADD
jgi:hypothetical protein